MNPIHQKEIFESAQKIQTALYHLGEALDILAMDTTEERVAHQLVVFACACEAMSDKAQMITEIALAV